MSSPVITPADNSIKPGLIASSVNAANARRIDWRRLARRASWYVCTAVLLWTATPVAQAGILDDFSTTTSTGLLLMAPGTVMHQDTGVAGVAGGDRLITLTATEAMSGVNSVGFEIAGSAGLYASGPPADGSVELFYDGATLSADVEPDLDAILVDFLMFDNAFGGGMDVTVTLSDGFELADLTITLGTSSLTPFTLAFDLEHFANIAQFDLPNLQSIKINFAAAMAQDFELAGIRTSNTPEPAAVILGAMALLCGGAMVARSRIRRRRQHAGNL